MTLRTAFAALLSVALLCVAMPETAGAADAQKRYNLRGLGAFTCGKYLQDRRADIRGTEIYAHWFTGFLTGYNYLQADTFEIAPSHDAKGLLTYLDLYCAKNQQTPIGVAAAAFVNTLYTKRQVSGQ